ncbi:MAG: (Fe-S)-binding protein [bacterium]
MDLARIKAIAVLGYNFNLHMLRSLVRRSKQDQAELFLSYFREDRLANLSEKAHRESLEFEDCVACGLCPASCRVMEASSGRFLGPMHIAAAASRSYPDLFHDADSIFLCAVCGQCEPACPEGVPVARMAASMRAMVWKVAPEVIPPAYQEARRNLESYGNIYGQPPGLESKSTGTDTALVLGPFLKRRPDTCGRIIEVLEKLGYEPALVNEGSIGGVAESIGLSPDTGWTAGLENFKTVIVADPDVWLALNKHELLEKQEVMFITTAVQEKLAGLDLGKVVDGPAALHDPAALGRYSGVAAEFRGLLESLGVELAPLREELDQAPPLGWEGGLDLVSPETARNLVQFRLSEASRAGAATFITPCYQDAALSREHGGDQVPVRYLMDILHEALL